MVRSARAIPRPVEALPCGSRSISNTFSPVTASAVARLIAVVVLPTPPFWLAIAKMRGGPGGVAMGSGPGVVVDTGDMADPEDAGAWRRLAGDARHLHVPLCRRRRQFGLDNNPLEEEANAAGGKKWGGQGKQMGQGGKGTGRDQRRRDKTCGLGADCVYTNGRLGGASSFAQEGCLAFI